MTPPTSRQKRALFADAYSSGTRNRHPQEKRFDSFGLNLSFLFTARRFITNNEIEEKCLAPTPASSHSGVKLKSPPLSQKSGLNPHLRRTPSEESSEGSLRIDLLIFGEKSSGSALTKVPD